MLSTGAESLGLAAGWQATTPNVNVTITAAAARPARMRERMIKLPPLEEGIVPGHGLPWHPPTCNTCCIHVTPSATVEDGNGAIFLSE
jgi:hypothetical protein